MAIWERLTMLKTQCGSLPRSSRVLAIVVGWGTKETMIWVIVWTVGIGLVYNYLGCNWCLAIGSLVARLNDACWAKPSVCVWDMIWMWFDCVLDFRFLASVHACIFDLATCIWYLATCILTMVSVSSWSFSLLGSTCAVCFNTWSFIQPSSFHFDIVLSSFVSIYTFISSFVLVSSSSFDKGSPVMFRS